MTDREFQIQRIRQGAAEWRRAAGELLRIGERKESHDCAQLAISMERIAARIEREMAEDYAALQARADSRIAV
jgi:hypothetical protein